MKIKKYLRRRFNWDIRSSWFNCKYIITLKIYRRNISQEFRLENKDETRNYLTEEVNRNELICKKHKNVCTTLDYFEHFIVIVFTIIGWVFISAFASLVGIFIGITSSAIG